MVHTIKARIIAQRLVIKGKIIRVNRIKAVMRQVVTNERIVIPSVIDGGIWT